MKFSDIFIFSIVSKRFYQMTRLHKFFLEESEFLNIVSFDEEHFDFLQTELQTFGKNIREKFKEKLSKIYLCLTCWMFCLKKLFMVYYHSKFIALVFLAGEVAKQHVNVIFATIFLLMTMTLEQELSEHLLSLKNVLKNYLFSIWWIK